MIKNIKDKDKKKNKPIKSMVGFKKKYLPKQYKQELIQEAIEKKMNPIIKKFIKNIKSAIKNHIINNKE